MSQQHAVIIGGSSGIGLAAAQQLVEEGFRVTIAGRDKRKLDAARTATRGAVTAVVLDASDEPRLREGFEEIGQMDHLILAFGSRKGLGPFATVNLSEVKQGFAEKVFPHFACAQAAIHTLVRTGSITFVSAVSAHSAMPGSAGIGAQNAAVAALVPILAAELKPLRVNGVSPGAIDTPWWDFLGEDEKAAAFAGFASKTPVGRVGTAEEAARAISFVVLNTFMTGHTVICDGGIRLAG